MPDNKTTKKDPQVETFLKNNPQYQDFFEEFPIPQNKVTTNPYYEVFSKDAEFKEKLLQEKSELYYLSNILNKELEKKNPKVYKELTSKYGWDETKPLSPKTRIEGANEYAKKNPNFYLNADEQKKVLGKDWDRYINLRNKYGSELNVIGEEEDPTKPETWKVGARYAVAFNPIGYTSIVKPESKTQTNKNISTFKRTEEYNPETENKYITRTTYTNINPEDSSKDVPKTYIKRLSKVTSSFDGKTQINTDDGVVFKEPGWKFYKVYDDGSKDEIGENDFLTMRKFNTLPSNIKNKYVEEVEESKNNQKQ